MTAAPNAPGDRAGRGRPARGSGGAPQVNPSLVGLSGAMRARDVSRVHADHLAAAARTLVVRHRPAEPS